MENVVLTIHLILALLLVGIVLIQRSEGGGLGMGGGGGGGGGVMSGRSAATALTRVTWILAAMFITTSVTLTIIAARKADSSSIIEQIGIVESETPAPLDGLPLSGTDALLPPLDANAPLAPPKAEN